MNVFTDQGDVGILRKAAVLAEEAPLHLDAFSMALEECRQTLAAHAPEKKKKG